MNLTLPRPSTTDASDPPHAFGWPPRIGLGFSAGLTVALAILNTLTVAADVVPTPMATPLVLLGVFFLPGIPITIALRIPGRALATVLAIAISASVNVLATQISIVAEWWNPPRTQTVLLVVATGACILAARTLPPNTRTGPLCLDRVRWTPARAAQLAALACSLVVFVVAARGIDIVATGNLGVIAQVGPWYIVGLTLLAAVAVWTLGDRRLDPIVLSALTAVTVVYNTMLVGLATGETSVPTSFVHRGFISVLAEHHHLPSQIDARFSWAGFFSLGAHVQTLGGLTDTTTLLVWAPLISGIVMSFGLYAVAISITGRARVAWLSVLLYHATNWYQQDYFAPQAMAMIGYTAILGTLFWQLRRAPLPPLDAAHRVGRVSQAISRTPGRVSGFGPGRTLAVGGMLLVVATATVVSHQMTPMLIILALAAFAFVGATRYKTLWLAAGLIFAAWFTYGATDFWFGHLQSIVNEVGQVGQSVSAGVGERLSGDPLYQRMQYLRMAASGGFVLLAFLGWWMWRGTRAWAVGGLVCAAPFVLVFLQSYGGEMIIRAFLLASPTLAPFAALGSIAVASRLRRRARPLVVIAAVALAVVVGLVETTNRGLNTAFEASTRDEVVLTEAFVDGLPADATVMSFSHSPHTVGVRRVVGPSAPRFSGINSDDCLQDLRTCALDRDADYVYITNQGLKMMSLQYGRSGEEMEREIGAIPASGKYVTEVRTPSVTILRRTDQPSIDYSDALRTHVGVS